MKYSNYIGIVAAVALIGLCYVPWVYIQSINVTITGMDTATTHLGKPGLLHIIFSVVAIVLFLVPYVTAKRINIFVAAFNMAWSVRNYLIVTQCQMGECPEKRVGIIAIVALSFILLIMTVIPKTYKQ
jgi:hypothetical protein